MQQHITTSHRKDSEIRDLRHDQQAAQNLIKQNKNEIDDLVEDIAALKKALDEAEAAHADLHNKHQEALMQLSNRDSEQDVVVADTPQAICADPGLERVTRKFCEHLLDEFGPSVSEVLTAIKSEFTPDSKRFEAVDSATFQKVLTRKWNYSDANDAKRIYSGLAVENTGSLSRTELRRGLQIAIAQRDEGGKTSAISPEKPASPTAKPAMDPKNLDKELRVANKTSKPGSKKVSRTSSPEKSPQKKLKSGIRKSVAFKSRAASDGDGAGLGMKGGRSGVSFGGVSLGSAVARDRTSAARSFVRETEADKDWSPREADVPRRTTVGHAQFHNRPSDTTHKTSIAESEISEYNMPFSNMPSAPRKTLGMGVPPPAALAQPGSQYMTDGRDTEALLQHSTARAADRSKRFEQSRTGAPGSQAAPSASNSVYDPQKTAAANDFLAGLNRSSVFSSGQSEDSHMARSSSGSEGPSLQQQLNDPRATEQSASLGSMKGSIASGPGPSKWQPDLPTIIQVCLLSIDSLT